MVEIRVKMYCKSNTYQIKAKYALWPREAVKDYIKLYRFVPTYNYAFQTLKNNN
jgi:hypothetical protein